MEFNYDQKLPNHLYDEMYPFAKPVMGFREQTGYLKQFDNFGEAKQRAIEIASDLVLISKIERGASQTELSYHQAHNKLITRMYKVEAKKLLGACRDAVSVDELDRSYESYEKALEVILSCHIELIRGLNKIEKEAHEKYGQH